MRGDQHFEIVISDLRKKTYTLRYWSDEGKIRLVGYQELMRESTRKRKYEVIRWYHWTEHRNQYDPKFIPVEEIELPQSVKQAFVTKLVEGLTFITTER